MKQKQPKLTERALISLLWAYYRILPENHKNGFFDLAQALAEEAGKKEQVVGKEKMTV